MYYLMQVALLRQQVPDPADQHRIDDVLLHNGALAAYETVCEMTGLGGSFAQTEHQALSVL